MAKSTSTTFDAPRAPHVHPDGQGLRDASEVPSSFPDRAHVDQGPVARRSPSLLHGAVNAPQVDASSGPSLVKQITRGWSSSAYGAAEPGRQSAEEIALEEPQPRDQTPCIREDACDSNTCNHSATSPTNAERRSLAPAATEISVTAVLESNQGRPKGDIPSVKVLLYGDKGDVYSAADTRRFKAACLKYVKGVHPGDIRVHSGPGPIGEEFHWFFDPNDIVPGGLLILCVTAHGTHSVRGVDIKMNKDGPRLMSTQDLDTAINRIQVPCTLEVVLATCNSEAVISGLDRLLAMEVPGGLQGTLLPISTLFKSFFPRSFTPELDTKAIIIAWVAAVDGYPAYPEADLPGRRGENDIMIGAICRALESASGTISRRALFGKIQEAVVEYNAARDEKYRTRTIKQQQDARVAGTNCGPQLACLLSSPGNQERFLDSPAFRAL
ncbi:unnamed protein product [Rhizoctonia solani]|uniref:Uncharacterized protein n=1 Tax=Rhizoctonia solani TaxID=456999 RepID=A0A8H3AA51_9AGAM|nr:unnamed protein product [Rhizoctonia solani]